MRVLQAIKPYYFYLICEGLKTIEIRKNEPKSKSWDRVVEIYCSKDMQSFNRIPKEFQEKYRPYIGKIGARFICNEIDEYETEFWEENDVYQDIRLIWINEDREDYDFDIITTNGREIPSDCNLLKNAYLRFDEIKKYVGYGDGKFYGWHILNLKIYENPKEITEFKKPCISPQRQYCPLCPVGGEHMTETEAELYRMGDEDCNTEWYCANYVKKPPQSWCYVEELEA